MVAKVYAMTCGSVTQPFDWLMEGAQGRIHIPIPAYLIVHPKGTAVFDTGMSMQVQREKAKALGPFAPFFDIHFEPGEDIAGRLEAIDRDPGKIDFIINSHLHFDHAGGNDLIPNASLIVQKQEWQAGHSEQGIAQNHYNPADYDHGHKVIQVDGEYDVFGDGSVRCLPTPGHTPGHQSLHVRTAHGEVCLCGDACYMRRTLAEMVPPLVVADRAEMLRSLEKIKKLEQRGVKIMYGHDPEFWETVPQAPAELT